MRRSEAAGFPWIKTNASTDANKGLPILDAVLKYLDPNIEEEKEIATEIRLNSGPGVVADEKNRIRLAFKSAGVLAKRIGQGRAGDFSFRFIFDSFRSDFEKLEIELAKRFGLNPAQVFRSVDLVLSGDTFNLTDAILNDNEVPYYSEEFRKAVTEGVSRFSHEAGQVLQSVHEVELRKIQSEYEVKYLEWAIMRLLQLGHVQPNSEDKIKFRLIDDSDEATYFDRDLKFVSEEYSKRINQLDIWLRRVSVNAQTSNFHSLIAKSLLSLRYKLITERSALPIHWQRTARDERPILTVRSWSQAPQLRESLKPGPGIDLAMLKYRIQSQNLSSDLQFIARETIMSQREASQLPRYSELETWLNENLPKLAIAEAEVAYELSIPVYELYEIFNYMYRDYTLVRTFIAPRRGDPSLKLFSQTVIDLFIDKVGKALPETARIFRQQTNSIENAEDSIMASLKIYRHAENHHPKYNLAIEAKHMLRESESTAPLVRSREFGKKELAIVELTYKDAIQRIEAAMKKHGIKTVL